MVTGCGLTDGIAFQVSQVVVTAENHGCKTIVEFEAFPFHGFTHRRYMLSAAWILIPAAVPVD